MDIQKDKIRNLKQYLLEEFSMDIDEATEMLDIFFDSIKEMITILETSIADSKFEYVSSIGHSINGTAANINANAISKLGRKLENAAKENNIEQCSEILGTLKSTITKLQSDTQEHS